MKKSGHKPGSVFESGTAQPNENTSIKPSSMLSIASAGSALTFTVKMDLSTVIICEIFTTEGCGSPDSDFEMRRLPGAAARARARFDVTTATMTVPIRLALKAWLGR
jgi:hypothetical protein